ncbi:MAG: nucleotidyltransferase domain-containing protein [Planctomycetota bacterium]
MRLTTEHSFLLRCVRAWLGGRAIDDREIPHLDWANLCAIAEQHQVAPLVYEVTREGGCAERLPQDARDTLLLAYHRTGMRNGFIRERVEQILREAVSRGIEVMLLKGSVLAYETYAQPEHRGLADVDLLVREHDFSALRQALEESGYQSRLADLRDEELPCYAHCVQQVRFCARTIPTVEVHFRLPNTGMAAAGESAWDDAEPVTFGDVTVCRPSAERFLLHLCLHAQQHQFGMLRLLVDLAVWLRSHPVDVERFVALIHRYHLATPAYYALTYTSDLLGLPDGDIMREHLRPTTRKRWVFERLWHDRRVRCLQASMGPQEAELPRAFLLGDAPIRDKLAFLRHVVLPSRRWLASAHGDGAALRCRHVARIVKQACRGLWAW